MQEVGNEIAARWNSLIWTIYKYFKTVLIEGTETVNSRWVFMLSLACFTFTSTSSARQLKYIYWECSQFKDNSWTGLWVSGAQNKATLEQFHHRLLPSRRKCDCRAERAWKGEGERGTSRLYWLASCLSQVWFQAKEHARVEETHCNPFLIIQGGDTHLWYSINQSRFHNNAVLE